MNRNITQKAEDTELSADDLKAVSGGVSGEMPAMLKTKLKGMITEQYNAGASKAAVKIYISEFCIRSGISRSTMITSDMISSFVDKVWAELGAK